MLNAARDNGLSPPKSIAKSKTPSIMGALIKFCNDISPTNEDSPYQLSQLMWPTVKIGYIA